jgi:hypothetical protein
MPSEHIPASPPAVSGPFETEAEARELPAVRAAYEAWRANSRRGVITERNHRMLCEAGHGCRGGARCVRSQDHRVAGRLGA